MLRLGAYAAHGDRKALKCAEAAKSKADRL